MTLHPDTPDRGGGAVPERVQTDHEGSVGGSGVLSFGACFMCDPPVSRVVALAQLAEAEGFGHAWLWDSHVLWEEVTPVFALMADRTSPIRPGPCVTTPATRAVTVVAGALATLS